MPDSITLKFSSRFADRALRAAANLQAVLSHQLASIIRLAGKIPQRRQAFRLVPLAERDRSARVPLGKRDLRRTAVARRGRTDRTASREVAAVPRETLAQIVAGKRRLLPGQQSLDDLVGQFKGGRDAVDLRHSDRAWAVTNRPQASTARETFQPPSAPEVQLLVAVNYQERIRLADWQWSICGEASGCKTQARRLHTTVQRDGIRRQPTLAVVQFDQPDVLARLLE